MKHEAGGKAVPDQAAMAATPRLEQRPLRALLRGRCPGLMPLPVLP